MSVAVITRSFAFMEYRKMRRSLFGLYPEKGRVTLFWGLAYSAVLFALVGLEHAGWTPIAGLQLHWDLDDVLLGSILTLVTLLTATKTTDVIRFCLYWVYVAMMVLLLTDGLRVAGARGESRGGEDAGDGGDARLPAWTSHALRSGLLCALVAAEVLTLATWYLIHYVMPAAVLGLVSRADLRLWWRIEVLPYLPWPRAAIALCSTRSLRWQRSLRIFLSLCSRCLHCVPCLQRSLH